MTDAELADFKKLAGDKAFHAFLYRMVRASGLFSVAALEGRSLDFVEGRRSLALDMLHELETAQLVHSPDGLPVMASIQIFLSVAQSTAKEKNLGRRSDPYGELSGDGDDAAE